MALDNKTAMITGGASGLGAALARRFAEEGASVSICGRRLEALEGLERDSLHLVAARCCRIGNQN